MYNHMTRIIYFQIQILLEKEEVNAQELDFFLRFPAMSHVSSPVDFLSDSSWGGIRSLSARDDFRYFIGKLIFEVIFENHVTFNFLTEI